MGRKLQDSNQIKNITKQIGSIKRTQAGFLMVSLVFFLPLLIGSILFLYLLSTHIETQAHIYDICRVELQETQSKVQKELSALIALNPIVSAVKTVSIALKIAMALSLTNPALFFMLSKWLKTLGSIENAIIKVQKFLIFSMSQTMRFGILLSKLKIYRELINYKMKLKNLVNLNLIRVIGSTQFVPAVEPKNKNSPLSEYKLTTNFERKQKLDINWEFNSQIIKTFTDYGILNRPFRGKCTYSLSEDKPWVPIQIAVRY